MTSKPRIHQHPRRPLLQLSPRQWWVLSSAYAGLIAIGAVVPIPPEAGAQVPSLDKVVHVCEYALLAWCLMRAARASEWSGRTIPLTIGLVCISYGMLLEGVQTLLPYRSAEWLDAAANTVGTGLGLWVSVGRPRRNRTEPRDI